eukprot:CAMPEP_0185422352 /NCGR_PEP_ID=MMETSP1365-20130426/11701_1 /TAXON_ID=38817 /ORGANISM="Gephyrocapsa oceanica, Strain RCC1303" /LENGTH=225 /DNA_ID=CAMNT_0028026143 /DNA_START=41 /DNA_END=715 /DNA_ORIENTATION=+
MTARTTALDSIGSMGHSRSDGSCSRSSPLCGRAGLLVPPRGRRRGQSVVPKESKPVVRAGHQRPWPAFRRQLMPHTSQGKPRPVEGVGHTPGALLPRGGGGREALAAARVGARAPRTAALLVQVPPLVLEVDIRAVLVELELAQDVCPASLAVLLVPPLELLHLLRRPPQPAALGLRLLAARAGLLGDGGSGSRSVNVIAVRVLDLVLDPVARLVPRDALPAPRA